MGTGGAAGTMAAMPSMPTSARRRRPRRRLQALRQGTGRSSALPAAGGDTCRENPIGHLTSAGPLPTNRIYPKEPLPAVTLHHYVETRRRVVLDIQGTAAALESPLLRRCGARHCLGMRQLAASG